MSRKFTPAAPTVTRIWPEPGSGTGPSTTISTSGPPCSFTTTDLIGLPRAAVHGSRWSSHRVVGRRYVTDSDAWLDVTENDWSISYGSRCCRVDTLDETLRFTDQVALVTGGAMGFGRPFAEAFSREGASVVLADIDADRVARTAQGDARRRLPCDGGDLRRDGRGCGGPRGGRRRRRIRGRRHPRRQRRPAPDHVQPAVLRAAPQGRAGTVRRQRPRRGQSSVACLGPMRRRGGG